MDLKEKIKKAETCVSYHNGWCSRDGYPPFDCEQCKCYREADKRKEKTQ